MDDWFTVFLPLAPAAAAMIFAARRLPVLLFSNSVERSTLRYGPSLCCLFLL